MDGLVPGHDVGADLALRIITEAHPEAVRQSLGIAVVVTDRSGHIVASARMDGAPLGALPIATDKAYSSALWNAKTGEMAVD